MELNSEKIMYDTLINVLEFLDIVSVQFLPHETYALLSNKLKESLNSWTSTWNDLQQWIFETDFDNPENFTKVFNKLGICESIISYIASTHVEFWNEIVKRMKLIKFMMSEKYI